MYSKYFGEIFIKNNVANVWNDFFFKANPISLYIFKINVFWIIFC